MANCVNPRCRQPIQDEFYFCPACGTDNRPPEKQQPLVAHTHQYGGFSGRFCIWCGEPVDEPYRFGHKWRLGIAWTLTVVGLSLAFAAIALWIAIHSQSGFWAEHLAWAKTLTWYRGRYGNGGRYQAEGSSYMILCGVGAVMAIALAVNMFLKLPLTRSSRLRSEDWI